MGRGPVLVTAPAVHPLLLEKLSTTAAAHGIAFQRLAMSRSSGTDADAFAYSEAGIPTVLLCVPIKYMHTTVEAAHKADIAASVDLLCHFILGLNLEELEAEGVFGLTYSVGSSSRGAVRSAARYRSTHRLRRNEPCGGSR